MSASAKLPRWAERGLLPLINLAAALILSGFVVKILGESPWAALKLLASGALGTQEGIGYTLYYATNFIFTGLGVAVAYHAGLFNIGCEGQAYVGGLGSGLVALWLGDRAPLLVVLPVAIMAGAAFGAAWALIPAWLQARRGSHIVITTIMFNFIAASLMTYLLVNVLIKPGQQSPESREFGANAFLPAAHELFAKIGITFCDRAPRRGARVGAGVAHALGLCAPRRGAKSVRSRLRRYLAFADYYSSDALVGCACRLSRAQ